MGLVNFYAKNVENGPVFPLVQPTTFFTVICILEMTWNIRSFSVNRAIEFETLHGSLVVYCCDFQRARSNLDVFDNLWCALSTAEIQSCMNCALHFGTMFMLHWKSMPTFRSFLLLHAFCMVLLSVREIHDVKTLNSELRSNSQLSACILYGTSTVEKMTWYIGSFLLQ